MSNANSTSNPVASSTAVRNVWPDSLKAHMAASVRAMNGRWRKAGCPAPWSSYDADDRDQQEYREEMSLGGETYRPFNGPYSGARGGQNR